MQRAGKCICVCFMLQVMRRRRYIFLKKSVLLEVTYDSVGKLSGLLLWKLWFKAQGFSLWMLVCVGGWCKVKDKLPKKNLWPTWGSWRGERRGYAALDHDPLLILCVYIQFICTTLYYTLLSPCLYYKVISPHPGRCIWSLNPERWTHAQKDLQQLSEPRVLNRNTALFLHTFHSDTWTKMTEVRLEPTSGTRGKDVTTDPWYLTQVRLFFKKDY